MYFISIPTPLPHSKDLPFLLKSEVQIKVHLPTEEYGSTPEEYATPQESCENQSFIHKEFHIFFTLALKKSSVLITCPWRSPDHWPSIRWVRIFNAISPVSCRIGNILSTPFSR